MLKVKSLYHLIVYSVISIVILISIFTFIIINNAHQELQEKITTIKEDYTSNRKIIVKNNVDYIIKFISYYYNENIHKENIDTIKQAILTEIKKLNLSNTKNEFIFIFDFNGNLLLDSSGENKVGENYLNEDVVKKFLKTSRNVNGGFIDESWLKQKSSNHSINLLSYVKSYDKLNWTIGKSTCLDNVQKLIKIKENEYNKKISDYTLQVTSLTILLIFYSIFIYKNATIIIVNDVKEIGNFFKKSEQGNEPLNQNNIKFGEFKVVANYAIDTINNIKIRTTILEELNQNLEVLVQEKTKELTQLVELQKNFLKNSVHEINTPLSIIRTNIDLLKMKIPNNRYITNIESGSKTIQYIYDDLSYMIKKDKVVYEKEYLDFSYILKERLQFFDEITKSNSLYFIQNIEEDIYIKFNNIELQRIIDNNISNAIKYSIVESPIFIKLYYLNDDEIEFYIATKSKKIENIDKIFEDYYRENLSRGGFGLGLKIVKDICNKNSVIIDVESNEKETKFIYRFKINENITS